MGWKVWVTQEHERCLCMHMFKVDQKNMAIVTLFKTFMVGRVPDHWASHPGSAFAGLIMTFKTAFSIVEFSTCLEIVKPRCLPTMRPCDTQIQLISFMFQKKDMFLRVYHGVYTLMITLTIPSASQIFLTSAISMVAVLLWSRRFFILPRTRDCCSYNPVPRWWLQLSADSLRKK